MFLRRHTPLESIVNAIPTDVLEYTLNNISILLIVTFLDSLTPCQQSITNINNFLNFTYIYKEVSFASILKPIYLRYLSLPLRNIVQGLRNAYSTHSDKLIFILPSDSTLFNVLYWQCKSALLCIHILWAIYKYIYNL